VIGDQANVLAPQRSKFLGFEHIQASLHSRGMRTMFLAFLGGSERTGTHTSEKYESGQTKPNATGNPG
jgi:hypothetical protein